VSPARKAASKAAEAPTSPSATRAAKTAKASSEGAPGPLVDAAWLAANREDPTVRIIHVGHDRRTYNKRHVPGAVYGDHHKELALKGTAPETGDAERESLLPTRDQLQVTLRAWRVGVGDRVVFYDDAGRNRYATRGYWLLRLYGFPATHLHVLDGGLDAWVRADGPTTKDVPEADLADGLRQPVVLGELDPGLVAGYDEVLAWSEAASDAAAPSRLLDVRTVEEWVGSDRRAARGGHIPGARQRAFEDLLTAEATFRSVDEMVSLVRGVGVDPEQLRAVYCQTGTRSALVWFVLSELAGFGDVRNYAGSWEEWGNRDDSPVECP
jgi:thiosulfate/3-mercaptopyruvate sulfurtransferase